MRQIGKHTLVQSDEPIVRQIQPQETLKRVKALQSFLRLDAGIASIDLERATRLGIDGEWKERIELR
jgi:hypothetical protein